MITYYQEKYVATGVGKLKSAFPMNWIHLAMPPFYGDMDSELSTKILWTKNRGMFLVRLRERNELFFSIDYFDGMGVQQKIDVDLDEEGHISNLKVSLREGNSKFD